MEVVVVEWFSVAEVVIWAVTSENQSGAVSTEGVGQWTSPVLERQTLEFQTL